MKTYIQGIIGTAIFFLLFSYPIFSGKTEYFTITDVIIISLPCYLLCFGGSYLGNKYYKNRWFGGYLGSVLGMATYVIMLILFAYWFTGLMV